LYVLADLDLLKIFQQGSRVYNDNRPTKSVDGPKPEHNPEPAIVLCPAIPEEVRQTNRHKYPIDGFDDEDLQECNCRVICEHCFLLPTAL
jgi:hypothetical protein